ncbi:MAG TPA: hypothetical protein VM287_03760 [Egibacteraceae bacterium]|nr:hypothetical protein [Egibacteraceae bacterium]
MNHTDEQLTRLFDRAFADETPGDGLWDATRTAMRRKVRARRAMVAASVAVVAAAVIAVPQMLLAPRTGPDVRFYEPPPPVEEPDSGPEISYTEKPLHLEPTPSGDADEPAAPAPEPAPGGSPASESPAPPSQQDDPARPDAPAEPPAQELTDWYTIHLHEEIEPGARYFSARQAMDALVASMRFTDGARVSHGVTDAQESSATGWIDVTGGTEDDTVSGEEIRVQLSRDDGGWFVEPVGQARAKCARGVDVTDRSRCV